MWRWVKWAGIGSWLVLAMLMSARLAAAHAITPIRTFPDNRAILTDSPSEIVLWFAEELISPTSTLLVLNAKGEPISQVRGRVDLNDPEHTTMRLALPPLPEGVFIVAWLVMSVDGDVSEGRFVFAIGQYLTPADLAQVLTPEPQANRWPLIVGSFVILALSVITIRRFYFMSNLGYETFGRFSVWRIQRGTRHKSRQPLASSQERGFSGLADSEIRSSPKSEPCESV